MDKHKPELLHSLRDSETMERIQKAKYKPVLQISVVGHPVRKWPSITHAANELGINRKAISNNLNGLSKTAGGFIWKLNG